MPHTTHAYPFERKVLGFAQALSARLAGGQGHDSFLMVLNPDGSVRTVRFEYAEDSWHRLTNKLDQTGTSYLFYDPFDAPEYTWLSWRRVERAAMERTS